MSVEFWNAQNYAKYATPQFDIGTKALSSWGFSGNENVLDIGCGNGAISAIMAQKYVPNGFVKAIDASSNMINFAKENFKINNLSFDVLDALSITDENKYDLITSFYCIHWIEDKEKLFNIINKSLKPNGRILLYIMTDAANQNYSIEAFVKKIIDTPKWQKFFTGFKFPWHFTDTNKLKNILLKNSFNIQNLECIGQQVIFKNQQLSNAWLEAMPFVVNIPQEIKKQLISEMSQNYFNQIPVNADGSVNFILPTIKVIAQKS